ncbi:unnamed protein product [Parnassius mnemosyne]|uniref:HAT C-terminal dimerisation domain-containing protein n=1 Tax=Parnassius mnemosyne TaxID=213953 RepID=A0AAV1M1Z6_9NEOP
MIPALYERTREEVRRSLADEVTQICITTDMWTSRANECYMAITGHYLTCDFRMKTVLISCDYFSDRHTSENLQNFLKESLKEWGLEKKVNFAISDNAANVQNALTNLGIKHYGCYGHTLNLVVQDATGGVMSTIDKVKVIVRHFKKSTIATEKLIKYQKSDNENEIPKKLIQEVPTRWNSMFHMIRRFVELEAAIRATVAVIAKDLPVVSNEEWRLLSELTKILKPFDEITESMSGEQYITASSVIVITKCLIRTCDKLLREGFCWPAYEVITALKRGLMERFENVGKSRTFGICTFLDPRYKISLFEGESEQRFVRKLVEDAITTIIDNETRTNAPVPGVSAGTTIIEHDKFSPWSALDELIGGTTGTPIRRVSPLAKAIQEIDRYLEDEMLPIHDAERKWNCPMEWWRNNNQKYPHLAKLFLKYGNIVATSVPCERMFSKAGLIISDRRTRLDHKKVGMIMFLNALKWVSNNLLSNR